MRAAVAAIAAVALTGCSAEKDATLHGRTTSPPTANALVLECDGAATRALTSVAIAGPEGVTIVIRNTAGRPLSVTASEASGAGGGFGADPGETRSVHDLRPGVLRLACFDARRDDPSEVRRVTTRVKAESTSWKDDRLRCASGGASALNLDYAADANGSPDPAQAAREALERDVRSGDDIEPAGYLGQADDRTYALARKNRNVAVVHMHRAANGWLVHLIERYGELDGP